MTETLMTPTHARRLLKLAAKLESLPRKDFDMGDWVYRCDESSCGTAGCAMGWAGMIPEFRRAGLKAKFENGYSSGIVELVPTTALDKKTRDDVLSRGLATWRWNDDHLPEHWFGDNAGEVFFGLTQAEAERLFFPAPGHETPKQVARNIRKVVKEHYPDLEKADRLARASS
jgi:hypothetical protein